MDFCLPKEYADKIIEALRSGSISPDKLSSIKDSASRREFLKKYVGDNYAETVNTLFEKKILLKNRDAAIVAFFKDITGLSKQKKAALAEKYKENYIEKQRRIFNPTEEEGFLNEITSDIYSKKYKTEVSLEEAQQITELSAEAKEAREKIIDIDASTDKQRLDYATAQSALKRYVEELERPEKEYELINPFKEITPDDKYDAVIHNGKELIKFIGENTRALVAGMVDNSMWGVQGVRALLDRRTTKVWAKNFLKSWKDIYRVFRKGMDERSVIMDSVYTTVYAEKNYLKGRYSGKVSKGKKGPSLDIGIHEDEYPTSTLPKRIANFPVLSKIPIFKQVLSTIGRVGAAAEVAFEAGAIRLRVDIANILYDLVEKNGVDLSSNRNVGGVNVIVNSMTGRGALGFAEKISKELNNILFSSRLLKSAIDVITNHALNNDVPVKLKWMSVKRVLNAASTAATILTIAYNLDKNSTDPDPRSAKFGTLYGVNIIGSVKSLLNLIARTATQSTKSAKTGIVSEFGSGFGQTNGMDVLVDYALNKTNPIGSAVRDIIRQRNFEGEKPTILNTLASLVTPINLSTQKDIYKDSEDNKFIKGLYSILSTMGFNVSTDYGSVWDPESTKEKAKFLEKSGEENFKKANEEFNREYNKWIKEKRKDKEFENLDDDKKRKIVSKKRKSIKRKAMNKYR